MLGVSSLWLRNEINNILSGGGLHKLVCYHGNSILDALKGHYLDIGILKLPGIRDLLPPNNDLLPELVAQPLCHIPLHR